MPLAELASLGPSKAELSALEPRPSVLVRLRGAQRA